MPENSDTQRDREELLEEIDNLKDELESAKADRERHKEALEEVESAAERGQERTPYLSSFWGWLLEKVSAAEENDDDEGGNENPDESEPDVHIDMDDLASLDEEYYRLQDYRGLSTNVAPDGDGQSAYLLNPADETDQPNLSYDLREGFDEPWEVNQQFQFYINPEVYMREHYDNARFIDMGINTEHGDAHSGGGGTPDGTNGWSARGYLMANDDLDEGPFGINVYTYEIGNAQQNDRVHGEFFPTGEWVTVDAYCRLNSISGGSANNDGVVRLYVDGEEIYSRSNYAWTSTEEQHHEFVGGVQRWGGSETPPVDSYFFYDEHKIWVDRPDAMPDYVDTS